MRLLIDDDYDTITIHMLTNDVRNFSPETCVDKHAEFIAKLQGQCQFAKVLISLPFFTVRDTNLNDKIESCHILMKYKFLNNQTLQVSETSTLYNKGVADKKFFVSDGIHLSNQGLKVFISNLKYHMRRSLGLETTFQKKRFAQGKERTNVHGSDSKQYEQSPSTQSFSPNQNYGYMFPPQFNYGFPQFPAFGNPPFFPRR